MTYRITQSIEVRREGAKWWGQPLIERLLAALVALDSLLLNISSFSVKQEHTV